MYQDAGLSGKTLVNRSGLQAALAALEQQRGRVLVVAKLHRL